MNSVTNGFEAAGSNRLPVRSRRRPFSRFRDPFRPLANWHEPDRFAGVLQRISVLVTLPSAIRSPRVSIQHDGATFIMVSYFRGNPRNFVTSVFRGGSGSDAVVS